MHVGTDRKKLHMTKHRAGSWLGVVATLLVAQAAQAAPDWTKPHSWRWPLYERVEENGQVKTGLPRPAVWNQTGEFQALGGGMYLHPGADIRGAEGDPVLVPADGTVERVFLYENVCLMNGTTCRIWFKTSDGRYLYYVGHVNLAPMPGGTATHQVTTEIREKIQNAVAGSGDRTVTAGQTLANIANFEGWNHLHVGIFDRQHGYAMQDTLSFLDQQPSGATGQSLTILDDEPPTIRKLELVQDQTSTSAITSGVCGDEVSSKVDVAADAQDTFFTNGTFGDFGGKGTLPPSTGIRSARYFVRSLATGQTVKSGQWYDLVETPLTCGADVTTSACLLANTTVDDAGFFTRMGIEDGAPSAGQSVLTKLFDTTRSVSNYLVAETYWHVLTNSQGLDGNWDASLAANGRYQVSAEISDFAGNLTAKSLFVTVHKPGTTLSLTDKGFPDVVVRDRTDDDGAVPSNLGGQPFWHSPDIILVPQGTTVTPATPAVETRVTANLHYDVYVRFKNTGCSPVAGVKARIFSANPAAISTNWIAIAGPGGYVGDTAHPAGVDIAAGESALLGPFDWVPTTAEAQFGGHRCVLAAVDSISDPTQSGNEFDAPGQNNVGQRNLQIDSCQYQVPNPQNAVSTLDLDLTTTAEVENALVSAKIAFDYDPAWFTAWSAVPGISVSQVGNTLVVRLFTRHVVLPQVTLAANAVQNLSFVIDQPNGSGTSEIVVTPKLNGQSVQGGSCSSTAQSDPH